MRFTADRDALLSALDRTRRVTPGAKESPASAQARISAVDGTLTLFGSDLTVFMACRMPAVVSEPGEIGVIPADLSERVRRMPEGSTVSIAAKEGRIHLTTDGMKRAFTLPYVETEDLPPHRGVSPSGDVTIAGDVLASHLKRVLPAAYQHGDRPNVGGVGFDGREMSIRLAASDGLRVTVTDVDGAAGDGAPTVRVLHLGAARVVAAEAAAMGNVGLVVDERGFSFSSEHIDIYVPHIGPSFPAYDVVIQSVKTHTTASVGVREMIAAVQAMGAVSKSTKLSLRDGAAHLFANSANDVAEDEVTASVVGDGGTVYLNTMILLDALKAAPSAKIDISIGADPMPIMLTCEAFKALIMPIAPNAMGAAA